MTAVVLLVISSFLTGRRGLTHVGIDDSDCMKYARLSFYEPVCEWGGYRSRRAFGSVCAVKLAFHDTDSPDTPASLRPTRYFLARILEFGIVECGLYAAALPSCSTGTPLNLAQVNNVTTQRTRNA